VELQKKVEVITKESQETKGQVDRMREVMCVGPETALNAKG
jgi:hypothetical protein